MKVLVISHAYASVENRLKLEALADCEGLEAGVVFPKTWRTWHGENLRARSSAPGKGPPPAEVGTFRRYQAYALPVAFGKAGGSYFYCPAALWKAIGSFNPDIIHVEEEPWTPVMLEVVLLNKLFLRKKLVFFSWENLDLRLGWWRSRIERLVFGSADLALAGNRQAAARLKKRGFRGKIEVLPQFGVDLEKFKVQDAKRRAELKKELGLSGFVVGFVGRLVEEKGLGTLFRSLAKLPREARLLLVSTTPGLPDGLRKLAEKLRISKRLVLAAGVPHTALPRYINLMDVFVLPSLTTPTWKEQFGRVLIEAMACKVAVIGSSSGAIPEVIGGGGWVFREGDADDLGTKIRELMSDERRRLDLAEKGFARVQEKYTFGKIAERTCRIYRSVC